MRNGTSTRRDLLCSALSCTAAGLSAAERQPIQSHTVSSEYQESPTKINVLPPDDLERNRRYRVLYVLSVDVGDGMQFGDALGEVRRLELQNRYSLVCVYATFSQTSWYADNPLNPRIRQESYFLQTVLPFVEHEYPLLKETRARLLVGLSKSGWGAFTLLLRHPDLFWKAAAWDAPLDETDPAKWRYFQQKFGTPENLQNYRIDLLLKRRAPELRGSKRLALMGYGLMRDLYVHTHQLMEELRIPHDYVDGPRREHRWDSGWLGDAVRLPAE
jgi:S-formylglutathione hydrolase FrmB